MLKNSTFPTRAIERMLMPPTFPMMTIELKHANFPMLKS
jgi:hypothetical protein